MLFYWYITYTRMVKVCMSDKFFEEFFLEQRWRPSFVYQLNLQCTGICQVYVYA